MSARRLPEPAQINARVWYWRSVFAILEALLSDNGVDERGQIMLDEVRSLVVNLHQQIRHFLGSSGGWLE